MARLGRGQPFAPLQFGALADTTSISVALTGQSLAITQGALTANTSVALTGQLLTIAQGAVAPSLSIALTGQALAIGQGAITAALNTALTGQVLTFGQGTIGIQGDTTVALTGQALTASMGALVPATSTALAGQAVAISQGSVTAGLAITLLGQSVSTATGTLGVAGGDVVVALTGQALSIALGSIAAAGGQLVQQDTFTGGFIHDFEREQARRRRERKKRLELEEETERIEEETTRQIAQLLREQEAKDARRAELARLSDLVARTRPGVEEAALSPRVQKAIRTAAAKQTAWALFQLEREMQRAQEEEAFVLQALRMAIENG